MTKLYILGEIFKEVVYFQLKSLKLHERCI